MLPSTIRNTVFTVEIEFLVRRDQPTPPPTWVNRPESQTQGRLEQDSRTGVEPSGSCKKRDREMVTLECKGFFIDSLLSRTNVGHYSEGTELADFCQHLNPQQENSVKILSNMNNL